MSTARLLHPKGESPAAPVNWLELGRSPHVIHFYSGDDFLLDSLSQFVSTALRAGDSCFVLATQAHLNGLAQRLKARGVDTDRAIKRRRYVTVDAFQVLAQLMVDGKLDKTRFDDFVRQVVLPLKAAAESKLRRVAVCGEVVALLWADGKAEAAIELEHLWNELATQSSYCLRCFYQIASFSDPRQNELFLKLCAEHARVIPCESDRDLAARVDQFEASPAS
jgi:MEDS: MEthanogen/methylotroph, DcmR Sensory domain